MTYRKKSRSFSRPRAVSTVQIQADTGLHLFTDGAAEPNPGAAGWGYAVYRDGQEIAHDYGGFEHATNNQAELTGLVRAVEWIASNAPSEKATIWTDSQYLQNGAMSWRYQWRGRGWKKKGGHELANLDLWKDIDRLLTDSPLTRVEWCRGHAGIPGNERADELASIGRASILPDNGFLTADIGALDREYRRIMEGSL